MAIFEGSRYVGCKAFYDPDTDITYFDKRNTKFKESIRDIKIPFVDGMRLDILAYKYYGNPELMWVIMDANPQKSCPEDFEVGDIITIPLPDRVINNVI